MQVGVRSKTDVCVCYIEGIADPGLVDIVKKELSSINVDGLTMADKVVEEYIVKQGVNPFPLVRYTERPDVAATHIFEGILFLLLIPLLRLLLHQQHYFIMFNTLKNIGKQQLWEHFYDGCVL